jgi:predicted double-glycine peptidase
MTPWLETFGVVALALLGAWLGHRASKLRPLPWALAEILPFAIVLAIGLSRRFEGLNFITPFSWLMEGRREFVMLGFAGTVLLVGATGLVGDPKQRGLIRVLAFVAVCNFAVLPFIQPAVIQHHLAKARTRIDANGICRQSYNYTCGPAAAVTALSHLGLPASEGELAILAHTSPIAGTAPDSLRDAIERRYGSAIECEYRHFRSVEQLNANGVVLAVVKAGALNDHFVAVLGVAEGKVTLGDPEEGLRIIPVREFARMWRGSGVVVRRSGATVAAEAAPTRG